MKQDHKAVDKSDTAEVKTAAKAKATVQKAAKDIVKS